VKNNRSLNQNALMEMEIRGRLKILLGDRFDPSFPPV
jgi:hypothetical protein